MVTRGFTGRNSGGDQTDRVPPGQHLVEHFPVLTAGPTPRVETANGKFTLKVGPRPVKDWNWSEFNALPKTKMTRDMNCVTSWAKLDTAWEGESVDDNLDDAGVERPPDVVHAHSLYFYSTHFPLEELASGHAIVALTFECHPLPRDHGCPARLLVPLLYFWKSATWVNALQFPERDAAGFWELRGYHIYGDPWREQRYTNDRGWRAISVLAGRHRRRDHSADAKRQELLPAAQRAIRAYRG